jgi:U32 family peptidase
VPHKMTYVTESTRIPLSLVSASDSAARWHEWSADATAAIRSRIEDAPEPPAPQGAYADGVSETVAGFEAVYELSTRRAELLAPAGGLEAGYAALHFGADALYLGLKKFSARAEAENFTLEEVSEITAYAHSLHPRRRVFVTINTVLRQDELPELVEALTGLDEIGVDAVILQDLGVYRALREHFPRLELHGSTQMAVHNRAGAQVLQQLGFARVVLARELTYEEVRDVTGTGGVETEVFVHGALCYSYSGLCLFSAQTLGRSGNRGKCAYSCRDDYEVSGAPLELRDGTSVKRDPRQGFPFSMKDLALPDHLPALRSAGVACFKIEGRKKSPLYVATATDYYRRLLDDKLRAEQRPEIEADLQTVFSRPWTRLFVQSHQDKEVADRDTVGHRGTLIGEVEAVRQGRLRFRTRRPLERHDGMQIDLPIVGKPFGFAVERIWVIHGRRSQDSFAAPAGSLVEVSLPADHPELPRGAPVYCSSSQVVKQKYRYHRPKSGAWRIRWPLRLEARLTAEALTVTGHVSVSKDRVVVTRAIPGPFVAARDTIQMETAVRRTFERLGDSPFALESFVWENAAGGFVPVSRLNALRRELVQEFATAVTAVRQKRIARIAAQICTAPTHVPPTSGFRWSIKVDRLGFLDALEQEDWQAVDEVVIDIARDHPATLRERLIALGNELGRERIRLALPALTRAWEDKGLRHKVAALRDDGWQRWEAANLSAWSYLGVNPSRPGDSGVDLATDWSIYVLNRLAAQEVLSLGATRFALSPEDGIENWRSLLAEFADRAVLIVYQDTPLFIAESCAYANLIGGCPGKANCRFESMEMVSSHGERVTALDYHCRTIVLNQGPYCLAPRLAAIAKAGARNLRADFIYRAYQAEEVRERWRRIRAGKPIAGGHAANFDRGIL